MDAIVTLVSLDHPWLPVYTGLPPCQSIRGCYSYSGIPGPSMVTSVYWSTPLVRVYVDAIVTLVSQDHPQLPVYTGLPSCQSIRGCQSYSGIPGPSMVTSVYWSTPLVRVYVDAIVTVVSQDHPQLPVYTGLPPSQSIHGCHSYSGIPEPSMFTSIYWSTPLSEYPWMPELLWYPWTIHGYQCMLVYPLARVSVDARVTLVSLDHPWLPVYAGLPPCQSIRGCYSYSGIPGPSMVTSVCWSTPLSEYPWML